MNEKKSKAKKLGAWTQIPSPEMVKIADISEAEYNPRVMPPEMMRALKSSIRKHGFVVNLVVQRRGMVLVGGHQRIKAMREVAIEDGVDLPEMVPCVILDLSDSEAKELNVALNKIDGEFDPYKLGALFASIRMDLTIESVATMGFTMGEVDEAMKLALPVEEQISLLEADFDGTDLGAFARSITLTVEFDTTEERDAVKEHLKALSQDGKRKAGKIVQQALKAYAIQHPMKKVKSKKAA